MANSTDYQFEFVEGQMHPHFPELMASFLERSNAVAALAGVELDVAYGAHERQRLDIFPTPQTAQGVMLYLHAGYWQSRDKSFFRWLSPAFNARGLHVVLANYPLCPSVTLAQLMQQLHPALAKAHGWRPEWQQLPFVVAGHSAGAHLATEFALRQANATTTTPADAATRIHGVFAISGIYDLRPLVHTTLNQRLNLSAANAAELSPLLHPQKMQPPAVWLVGAQETPEFLRQNRSMHEAWLAQGNQSHCLEEAATDHFTILQHWTQPEGQLATVWDAWWQQVLEHHQSTAHAAAASPTPA